MAQLNIITWPVVCRRQYHARRPNRTNYWPVTSSSFTYTKILTLHNDYDFKWLTVSSLTDRLIVVLCADKVKIIMDCHCKLSIVVRLLYCFWAVSNYGRLWLVWCWWWLQSNSLMCIFLVPHNRVEWLEICCSVTCCSEKYVGLVGNINIIDNLFIKCFIFFLCRRHGQERWKASWQNDSICLLCANMSRWIEEEKSKWICGFCRILEKVWWEMEGIVYFVYSWCKSSCHIPFVIYQVIS